MERITLAHIFDAVEDARDLLAHWAKAMRLGPFKSDKPKSILDQAYDVLESMGAIEQRAFLLSVLQQILNEKAAKLAIDSTATRLGNSGFSGGGKK